MNNFIIYFIFLLWAPAVFSQAAPDCFSISDPMQKKMCFWHFRQQKPFPNYQDQTGDRILAKLACDSLGKMLGALPVIPSSEKVNLCSVEFLLSRAIYEEQFGEIKGISKKEACTNCKGYSPEIPEEVRELIEGAYRPPVEAGLSSLGRARELGQDFCKNYEIQQFKTKPSKMNPANIPLKPLTPEQVREINEELYISGRDNPIKVNEMVEMMLQVAHEEKKNSGIVPSLGKTHEWSDEVKKNSPCALATHFPKLLIALGKGETSRFMVTGQEDHLMEWALAQESSSITPDELFRVSYRLNRGDFYLTLLSIENILSRNWLHPDRDNFDLTKKLAPIANYYQNRGDKYGAWYHLFGIMLYGYAESAFLAPLIGRIEDMGASVLHGEADHQNKYINISGGKVGGRLRRALKRDPALENFRPNPASVSPQYYLNLNEDFRDRIAVSLDPRFNASLDGKRVSLKYTGNTLNNCTVEIIPCSKRANGSPDCNIKQKIVKENITITKGSSSITDFRLDRVQEVRMFFSNCRH